ncbi:MAG: hypothetical protein KGJ34_02460 [Patescibacteria group bacterium]|nr:hypothetical protein [Patescibacteria group bacterium]
MHIRIALASLAALALVAAAIPPPDQAVEGQYFSKNGSPVQSGIDSNLNAQSPNLSSDAVGSKVLANNLGAAGPPTSIVGEYYAMMTINSNSGVNDESAHAGIMPVDPAFASGASASEGHNTA